MEELLKNKEILEYYGIYKKRTLTEKQTEKYLKLKRKLEKLIEVPIERMYLIGQNAWGKEYEKDIIYIAIDKRFKDLKNEQELLTQYAEENDISFLLTSLCSYEKRKNIPTEIEYLIIKYGIEIFNSQKDPTINERIISTQYAIAMSNLKFLKTATGGEPMEALVQAYILKLGYPINKYEPDLRKELKIIKLISKDEKAIELIEQYIKETDKIEKRKISKEFGKILRETKQVKYEVRLENNPTMQVYEKLEKQKGKLDIKNLTKEELYIMYITQRKSVYDISELYGVENQKINNKRDYYNIKLKECSVRPENLKKYINSISRYKKYIYAMIKDSWLSFENCIMPILNYIKDGDTYLLKEFWKFCKRNPNSALDNEICTDENAYFKAELCADFLVQNELINEIDYKQYRITKKGKKLLENMHKYDINKTDIPTISKCLPDLRYYSLEYKEGYPKNIDDILGIFVKIKKELEIQLDQQLEDKTRKEQIYISILAFINTIIENPKIPEKIKQSSDVQDLGFILETTYKRDKGEVKLEKNIISSEIYKYIQNIKIKDIVKFSMANYNHYGENNIKVEEIGE